MQTPPHKLSVLKAPILTAILGASLTITGFAAYGQSDQGRQAGSADINAPVTMTGTVQSYNPGKSIEIEVQGTTHVYDLSKSDTTFTVSSDVQVGSKVRLMETKEANGHRLVTIEAPPNSEANLPSTNATSPNTPSPINGNPTSGNRK